MEPELIDFDEVCSILGFSEMHVRQCMGDRLVELAKFHNGRTYWERETIELLTPFDLQTDLGGGEAVYA